jgi:hypothetical protein
MKKPVRPLTKAIIVTTESFMVKISNMLKNAFLMIDKIKFSKGKPKIKRDSK